jgi:hypothetical protein
MSGIFKQLFLYTASDGASSLQPDIELTMQKEITGVFRNLLLLLLQNSPSPTLVYLFRPV